MFVVYGLRCQCRLVAAVGVGVSLGMRKEPAAGPPAAQPPPDAADSGPDVAAPDTVPSARRAPAEPNASPRPDQRPRLEPDRPARRTLKKVAIDGRAVIGEMVAIPAAELVRNVGLTRKQAEAIEQFEQEFAQQAKEKLDAILEGEQANLEALSEATFNKDNDAIRHYKAQVDDLLAQKSRLINQLVQEYTEHLRGILSESQLRELGL